MDFRWDLLVTIFPILWSGFLTTLGLTLSSLLAGLVFGLILALMKISTN